MRRKYSIVQYLQITTLPEDFDVFRRSKFMF